MGAEESVLRIGLIDFPIGSVFGPGVHALGGVEDVEGDEEGESSLLALLASSSRSPRSVSGVSDGSARPVLRAPAAARSASSSASIRSSPRSIPMFSRNDDRASAESDAHRARASPSLISLMRVSTCPFGTTGTVRRVLVFCRDPFVLVGGLSGNADRDAEDAEGSL